MSPTDLDDRLTALFEHQAGSLHVPEREWSEVVRPPARTSRRRWAWRGLAVGVAAAVPLVLALVLVTGPQTEQVTTGAGAPGPFRAETRQVSLSADSLTIEVGGRRYAPTPQVEVHSDPGTRNEYTTLELTWHEDGVEMRLNVYFASDGREWGAKEIRTYDGATPGEWITYEGDFFRSPLGTAFAGNFTATASRHGITGQLRMPNLRLEAFRRPAGCTAPTAPYTLEPTTDSVRMERAQSGYGLRVELLDSASCAPVPDPSRFDYAWATREPGIVTITATGPTADLAATAPGSTTLQVTARDTGTGEVVGTVSIEVVVSDATGPPAVGSDARERPRP